jgi:benzoate membrane transport protein
MSETTKPGALSGWITSIGAAVPLSILLIAMLTLPLAAAASMGLTTSQTASWILVLYGLPAVGSLALAYVYRQPLFLTGNVFVLIFITSLGGRIPYAELIGAAITSGAVVLVLSLLGLTGRLGGLVPAPVVMGLLAGAVMPFFAGIFTFLGQLPVMIGGVFVTYLLWRWIMGERIPAILPALFAGLVLAFVTGSSGSLPENPSLPVPVITPPVFNPATLVSAVPVMVILITLQANLPSLVFLRTQGYHPPERLISTTSGIGMILASFLGPTALSLSLPSTSLLAGEDAGHPQVRYRGVYLAAGVTLLVALFAGAAAFLPQILPLPLLLSIAGLAVIGVVASALQTITRGPLVLGPLFAFAVALSEISLLGLGPFFWALVIGTGVSYLLERDALSRLRAPQAAPAA